MSGDRTILEAQWRSTTAPKVSLPLTLLISLVIITDLILIVAAAFIGGVLRWLIILLVLGATALALIALSFGKAGFKRRHLALLEERFRKRDVVECTSALVRRAEAGSNYSQMVVRERMRGALLKRLAAKHAMTYAQVEELVMSGRAGELVDDENLLKMLAESEMDRSHWTDRVVGQKGPSGRDYERGFIDIIERTEGL